MSLVSITRAYSETFDGSGSPSATWIVQHNLNTSSPVVDTYNNSDTRIMPASVIVDSANQVTINWSGPTVGRVYVV